MKKSSLQSKIRNLSLALSTLVCVLGKGCLLAGGIGATLCSCRVRYVAMPEVHQRDSLRISSNHRLDSIRIGEWHFLFQRGDTVYKTDSIVKEKIVEVEVHDTVTNHTRDSVPYPVEVPIEVPTPVPRFYIRCTIGFWLFILGFILYIAMRLYLRR